MLALKRFHFFTTLREHVLTFAACVVLLTAAIVINIATSAERISHAWRWYHSLHDWIGDLLAVAVTWGLIIFLGFLTGCTMAPYGAQVVALAQQAEETAVKDRMQYNDNKAEVLVKAICDMSVGAFYRINNISAQTGVVNICSGEIASAPKPTLLAIPLTLPSSQQDAGSSPVLTPTR